MSDSSDVDVEWNYGPVELRETCVRSELPLQYSTSSDFEAVLKSIQGCKDPSPPYAKKITIISKYKVEIVKGIRYLSGNTTITAPTQFLNFSARTFVIDSTGKRVMKYQISQVSCRNLFAKAILVFANLSFTTKDCILNKGISWYELDMNKVVHALPIWHASGNFLHELQLVRDGTTEFCHEISVAITD